MCLLLFGSILEQSAQSSWVMLDVRTDSVEFVLARTPAACSKHGFTARFNCHVRFSKWVMGRREVKVRTHSMLTVFRSVYIKVTQKHTHGLTDE